MIATSALIADLCGEAVPARPTVAEALACAMPGTVTAARADGRPVALVVLADRRAYAVDDRCPHDGGSLSDGFLDGDTLVCARHGWSIDPCSGACGRRAVATTALGRLAG